MCSCSMRGAFLIAMFPFPLCQLIDIIKYLYLVCFLFSKFWWPNFVIEVKMLGLFHNNSHIHFGLWCFFVSLNSQVGGGVGFRVLAVFGEEEGGGLQKKKTWEAIFQVEDPRPRVRQSEGKFLDVNQALEVARFDIQYCDWRARHDLLTIMILHDKVADKSISAPWVLHNTWYV